MKTLRECGAAKRLACWFCALASLLAGASPVWAAMSRPGAAAEVPPACDWARPGYMPFMGDVVGAVDHYRDIPAPVRAKLKQRMAERRYDEIVEIRRDSIVGNADYDGSIRQMHFGDSGMCSNVTRKTWTPDMTERGLVYCESDECILVPTVCRNVSRISRRSTGAGPAGGDVAAGAPGGELLYEPPAAGPPSALRDPLAVTGGGPATFADDALPSTGAGPGAPIFAAYGSFPTSGGGRVTVAAAAPDLVPAAVPGVPEPQSMLLMLAGLAGLAGLRCRRRPAGAGAANASLSSPAQSSSGAR